MRFRFKIIFGSFIGLIVTLLIIHWEFENANVQWKWSGHIVPQVIVDKNQLIQQRTENKQEEKNTIQSPSVTKLVQNELPKLAQIASDGHQTGYFSKVLQDTYIYSAFLESLHNEKFIRLIVLSSKAHQPQIVCNYCHKKQASCQCLSQAAVYYAHNENHGRQYGGFIASCVVPECFDATSRFIDLTVQDKDNMIQHLRLSLVSTTGTGTSRHDYSVCIPPLRGEGIKSLYKVIEFIELTVTLGAAHLTFYDYEIDNPLKKLLAYYEEKGVITVMPWNLPTSMTSNINQLWYYGQVLAIQDCLYRYRASSKFVAFNDIDEFIVPLQHPTVPLLMQDINRKEFSGHCFNTVIFSLNARLPVPRKNKHRKLNSLRIQHRTSDKLPKWSKCIVDPQKVFEMGIHHISKPISPQFSMSRVDEKLGLLFHYRKCSSAYGIGSVCGHFMADDTMERFTNNLQIKVDTVLEHLRLKAT